MLLNLHTSHISGNAVRCLVTPITPYFQQPDAPCLPDTCNVLQIARHLQIFALTLYKIAETGGTLSMCKHRTAESNKKVTGLHSMNDLASKAVDHLYARQHNVFPGLLTNYGLQLLWQAMHADYSIPLIKHHSPCCKHYLGRCISMSGACIECFSIQFVVFLTQIPPSCGLVWTYKLVVHYNSADYPTSKQVLTWNSG